MRVLYVDDDLTLGKALTRLLERRVDVVYQSSVAAAKHLLESEGADFDVVVSDVMMPGETGPDFHRWVRQEHPLLTKRWVFMTGGLGEEDRKYIESSGAELVWKPDVKRLMAVLGITT